MYLEIITPSSEVFKGEVDSIILPGDMGQFQVLDNHAPIISTLTKGKIVVKRKEDTQYFTASGGIFECSKNKANILLESLVEK